MCQNEPVDEKIEGGTKTTYVELDGEKIKEIISERIVGKKPVSVFTIGAVE